MFFDVDLGALRADAGVWRKASDELAEPANAIRPLTLELNDLTPLGNYLGLRTTYEKARAAMERLMDEAAVYFDRIEDSLIEVAKEYEQTDQTGQGRFDRQQDQLGRNR